MFYYLAAVDWEVTDTGERDSARQASATPDRELPEPDPLPDRSLNDVMLDRRTCREFDGSTVEATALSSIR